VTDYTQPLYDLISILQQISDTLHDIAENHRPIYEMELPEKLTCTHDKYQHQFFHKHSYMKCPLFANTGSCRRCKYYRVEVKSDE
jgi:hypothetical protein